MADFLITKLHEINRFANPADGAANRCPVTRRRFVVCIHWHGSCCLGVIVRIGLWFAWSGWSPLLNADAEDYQGLATRLATTGAYSSASR